MRKTKPNPWNLAGPHFIGLTLSSWLLTLGICQALNAPDWVLFVLVPAWLLAIPAAAWSAVRLTERVYAAHAPVFDWAGFKRDADIVFEALLGLLAGLAVRIGVQYAPQSGGDRRVKRTPFIPEF